MSFETFWMRACATCKGYQRSRFKLHESFPVSVFLLSSETDLFARNFTFFFFWKLFPINSRNDFFSIDWWRHWPKCISQKPTERQGERVKSDWPTLCVNAIRINDYLFFYWQHCCCFFFAFLVFNSTFFSCEKELTRFRLMWIKYVNWVSRKTRWTKWASDRAKKK